MLEAEGKRRGKKSSFKIHMFLEFYLFLLLPLLLLGLIGMRWASSTVLDNARKAYSAAMENTGGRITEYVDGLADVINIFCEDPLLSRIAYMQGETIDYSRVNLIDLQNYKMNLVFHCASSRLYNDIIICFPQKNSIVSTLGVWRMDWFFEDEFLSLNMDSEKVRSCIGQNAVLPGLTISRFGVNRYGTAFFRNAIKKTNGDPLMTVIFWTNDETWGAHLNDLLLYEGAVVGLYAADGVPISIQKRGESQNDDQALLLNGSSMYESLYWTDAESGYSLRAAIPKEAIYGGVRRVNSLILLILLIVALVGGGVSWELASLNYKPLEHLMHTLNLHMKTSPNPKQNEMDMIEQKLLTLLDEQDVLRKSAEDNHALLQYAALSHLLEGEKAYQALTHQAPLSILGIKMPYRLFQVLAVYRCADEENLLGTARALCAGEVMRVYSVKKNDLLFLLVNYQDKTLLERLIEALSPLCTALSISDEQTHPSALSLAYHQALETLNERPVTQKRSVFYYSEITDTRLTHYSAEDERRLLGALRAGDQKETERSLDALLQKNATIGALKKLNAALEMAVLKTDDGHGVLPEKIRRLHQPDALSAIEQTAYARSLLTAAVDYHQSAAAAVKSALADKLLLFIDENLCDEQLSLTMTAEKFSLSTAYLSRYFKEQLGVNYLDYVNKKRVLIAKEMLAGGLTVREAAQRSGFGSDAALRRVYKKYEGVVPSAVSADK